MVIETPFTRKDQTKPEQDKGRVLCPFLYVPVPVPPKLAGGPMELNFIRCDCPKNTVDCPLWIDGKCVRIEAYKKQARD